ncbi:zinc ribbon domain-containing protein [uncultured Megasphaera sp.]|uniref:zinc ribbon domain-containing protein n=1 Tax=uncultured Megasphaera sp. TaxID=165188 RepID=UPI0025F2B3B0|nr:zinc ribbon domain-containing protein [uncultured Megasphaera sp.]
MFCSNCGAKLADGAKFCSNCGAKVANTEVADSEPKKVLWMLNGVQVDVVDLAVRYKLYKKRNDGINAAKEARQLTGCSLRDSVTFISSIKSNENALALAEEKAAQIALEAEQAKKAFDQEGEEMQGLFCPKCHSRNIYIDKKGYSLTKGIVGTALLGPLGLIAGKHHSNRLRYTCMDCGHKWHD